MLTKVLIDVVLAVLTIVGPIVAKLFADKMKADTQKSKAEKALIQLGAVAVSMAGRAWDQLKPEIQLALADGKVTAEERAAIEAKVRLLVDDFTSKDDLEAIAKALGLPFAGVISQLAAMLIDKFVGANDPEILTQVSAFTVKEFVPEPVAYAQKEVPASQLATGAAG